MSKDLERARADAKAARARMLNSAHTLQDRLKPTTLANHALEAIRTQRDAATRRARIEIAKRPAVLAVAAVGLAALVARKPIGGLFARLRRRRTEPSRARRGKRMETAR